MKRASSSFVLILATAILPISSALSQSFPELRLGMFVHYMWVGHPYDGIGTTWSNGSTIQNLDELADNLDVSDLVQVAKSMRAQYLEFTTWHANMNALYPSDVLKRMLPGHCSRRDVIRDLIEALKPTGIHLILYIHPSDGHDFSWEDQQKVGWHDGPPFARWNDFVNQVCAEVVDRYGKDVAGYWIDGALPQQVDAARLRATIIRRDPDAWLIQNSALDRDCVDYGAYERFDAQFSSTVWQMNAVVTGQWWANQGSLSVSPEFAFKYTVLQAGTKDNTGGVAWAFSPHPGGRWETGVREFAKRLGEYVDRVRPALFPTRPSAAFVTREGTALKSAQYVATESMDGRTTFVHVLWPPQEQFLTLRPPANGRLFKSAKLLSNGRGVEMRQDAHGLQLKLGRKDLWDLLDTVIVLK